MHGSSGPRKIKKKRDFVPLPWKSSLPKPLVCDDVWGFEGAQDIAFYIDWHRRHPNCSSPRKLAHGEVPEPGEVC